MSLGNLSQLQILYLSQNYLSKDIPSTLGNLTQLEQLEVYSNLFTKEIPFTLGSLSQLQVSLYLATCYPERFQIN
jgi:Leucine-rich repeat (LRR) protein